MTDEELIAALRDAADWHAGRHVAHLTTQAADRLSACQQEVGRSRAASIASGNALYEARVRVAELVKALEPFSTAADDLDDGHQDHTPIWEVPCAMSIDAGHLRRARAALGGQSNG